MSSKTEFEKDCLRPNLFPQFASWVEETKVAPYNIDVMHAVVCMR